MKFFILVLLTFAFNAFAQEVTAPKDEFVEKTQLTQKDIQEIREHIPDHQPTQKY